MKHNGNTLYNKSTQTIPKRARNAYNLFIADKRKDVVKELEKRAKESPEWFKQQVESVTNKTSLRSGKTCNLGTSRVMFSITTNELAHRWRICRDLKNNEWKKYSELAAADRNRCTEEKLCLAPLEKRNRFKKPDQPMNVRSAYNYFVKHRVDGNREFLHSSGGFVGVQSSKIAAEWKSLSETERKPFIDAMNKDRERFKRETLEVSIKSCFGISFH